MLLFLKYAKTALRNLVVPPMGLVLLATQGADAAATASAGITFVWAMLPGPNRSALWRWTDGTATVPALVKGPALLEVTVAQTLDYPLVEPAAAGIAGLTQAA